MCYEKRDFVVDERVISAVMKFAVKHEVTKKVQKAILAELRRDLILPSMRANATIRLMYEERDGADARDDEDGPSIEVVIGCRDFSFDAKTGECFGAGTCLV